VEPDRTQDPEPDLEPRDDKSGDDRRQDREPGAGDGRGGGEADDRTRSKLSRSTWLILLPTAIVVVLALAAIAVGFLPLWWARRVSAAVDGSRGLGAVSGTMIGFVFTAAPMLVFRQVLRRNRTWRSRGWLLFVTSAAGFPDLLTLGMMLGNYGHAAQAREVVDLGAPGFRAAMPVGAVAGAVGAVALWWLWDSRARRGRRIAELEDELRRTAS
jgi:hypothetical protein